MFNHHFIAAIALIFSQNQYFSDHAAANSTEQMVTDLTAYSQRLPAGDDNPLILACLDFTFKKWADTYNDILATSTIVYSNVKQPLDSYADNWYRSKHNLIVADFFHPEIETQIAQVFSEGMIRYPNLLSAFDPAQIKVDDFKRGLYDNYMNFCFSSFYLQTLKTRITTANVGRVIPPEINGSFQGKASWTQNAQGGIVPKQDPGSQSDLPPQFEMLQIIGGGFHE